MATTETAAELWLGFYTAPTNFFLVRWSWRVCFPGSQPVLSGQYHPTSDVRYIRLQTATYFYTVVNSLSCSHNPFPRSHVVVVVFVGLHQDRSCLLTNELLDALITKVRPLLYKLRPKINKLNYMLIPRCKWILSFQIWNVMWKILSKLM